MITDDEIRALRDGADEYGDGLVRYGWYFTADQMRSVCDAALGGHHEARNSLGLFQRDKLKHSEASA